MERETVVSSNIDSIGYDADKKLLEVEFTSGEVWQYTGVSAQRHKGLMDSSSKGKYFNQNIRGQYTSRKVS